MAARRERRPLKGHRDDEELEGTVVRVDSRLCIVQVGTRQIKCRVRGVLFREEKTWSRPVAAGDRVGILKGNDEFGLVHKILPRRNILSRPQVEKRRRQLIASNLDQVLLVSSTITPDLNLRLVDRILVACERGEFNALIIVNKVDLLPDRTLLQEVHNIYEPLGYKVIETSASTGEGVDVLRSTLEGKISVLAGMSGVGKSTLLNAIQPGLKLKAQTVSDATGKGRHTTTRSELLPLDGGGFVVDTPGMREFGIADIEPYQVGLYFPEIRKLLPGCHFRTCTHTHEKICAVTDAVENGEVHPHRFDSYLRIIEGL